MSTKSQHPETLVLHAGYRADSGTHAVAVPIYQTTSFVFEDFEQAKAISSVEEFGFDYTRITNPTCEVLENRIAVLEGGTGALALASGSAATAYSVLGIRIETRRQPSFSRRRIPASIFCRTSESIPSPK